LEVCKIVRTFALNHNEMANAGHSKDNKLVKQLLKTGKILPINYNEPDFVTKIKLLINDLVLNDKILTRTLPWGKHEKYEYHSAWERQTKVMIKINQIRIRNWYFNKLD
jgi:hypothetical protein